MFWTVVGVITACFLVYYAVLDLYLIYVRRLPPGPLSLPLIGGLHHMDKTQPQKSLEKLVKRYGSTLSLRLGPKGRVVFLHDIEYITQLMHANVANDRPPHRFIEILNVIRGKTGNGIGSMEYGTKWKKITRRFQHGIARLSHESFSNHVNNVFSQLFERFPDQSSRHYNPRPDVIKVCSSILSSLVYGRTYASLDDADLQSRIHCHSHIMAGLNPTHPVNLLPGVWHIPTAWKALVEKCLKERDSTLYNSLHEHCQAFTGEIHDLMDIITDYTSDTDKDGVTLEDMLISIWTTYMAGSETMTDTILWAMLYLALDPEIQARVYAEVDQFVPHDRQPQLGDKEHLNYTQAVLMETLRDSSTNPIGVPHYTRAGEIQVGKYIIPKGTMIFFNHWHVHHSKTYWDDPFTFNPDRFLDENGKILSSKEMKKLAFIPFSLGKRPCLGQYLAQDIMLLFIAGIMQRFMLRLPDNFKPDLGGRYVFGLRPSDFQIIITPRCQTLE